MSGKWCAANKISSTVRAPHLYPEGILGDAPKELQIEVDRYTKEGEVRLLGFISWFEYDCWIVITDCLSYLYFEVGRSGCLRLAGLGVLLDFTLHCRFNQLFIFLAKV